MQFSDYSPEGVKVIQNGGLNQNSSTESQSYIELLDVLKEYYPSRQRAPYNRGNKTDALKSVMDQVKREQELAKFIKKDKVSEAYEYLQELRSTNNEFYQLATSYFTEGDLVLRGIANEEELLIEIISTLVIENDTNAVTHLTDFGLLDKIEHVGDLMVQKALSASARRTYQFLHGVTLGRSQEYTKSIVGIFPKQWNPGMKHEYSLSQAIQNFLRSNQPSDVLATKIDLCSVYEVVETLSLPVNLLKDFQKKYLSSNIAGPIWDCFIKTIDGFIRKNGWSKLIGPILKTSRRNQFTFDELWNVKNALFKLLDMQCLMGFQGGFLEVASEIAGETYADVKNEFFSKIVREIENHLDEGFTTIYFDIEQMIKSAAVSLVPLILEHRRREIEEPLVVPKYLGCIDLRPIWNTVYGFQMLHTMNMWIVTDEEGINKIKTNFEEAEYSIQVVDAHINSKQTSLLPGLRQVIERNAEFREKSKSRDLLSATLQDSSTYTPGHRRWRRG